MEAVNPAFSLANMVFLVTTPEILTLKNTKSSLLVFKELGYPESKLRVVLNKAARSSVAKKDGEGSRGRGLAGIMGKGSGTGINRRDVESTLGIEVFAEIQEDFEGVRKSQNEGEPYVSLFPKNSTTSAFTQLVKALTKTESKSKSRRW